MKVCFTGGGTGGHVFPVFPIDEQLKILFAAQNIPYDRFWIGTGLPQERNWIEGEGIRYLAIRSGKLRRYFSLRNILDMMNLMIGLFQSIYLLRKERPDVVFSKGGYVSVLPVVAAALLKIPTITHESDAKPGLATKINARFVSVICIADDSVKRYFKSTLVPKVVVTGIPIRIQREQADANRARLRFGIPKNRPLIVILGGSQGALQVNTMVWQQLERLLALGVVVHQTGEKTYREIERPGYHAIPFITDGYFDLLAAATVVISRSGATALAECIEMGVPMVLVPLGRGASRGEQWQNTERLSQAGAAQVLVDDDSEGKNLYAMVERIVCNDTERAKMVKAIESLREMPAAPRIAKVIMESVQKG